MKSENKISLKKSFGSAALFLFLVVGSLFIFRENGFSASISVDSNGSVQYFGSRKVLYMSSWQLYWVFWQDGSGNFAYASYDKTGTLKNSGVAVTSTTVGGSVLGSIWYVDSSSSVYVVAANGRTDTIITSAQSGTASQDDWYLYRFLLASDGSISQQNSRTMDAESCTTNGGV